MFDQAGRTDSVFGATEGRQELFHQYKKQYQHEQ